MKIYNFVFLLCILLNSCHDGFDNVLNGPNRIITQFPIEETIKGKKMEHEIIGINDIFIVDTLFIAFKASGYNNFFEIYSTNNFKFLGSFLPKGRGPNEFLSVNYNNEYLKTEKGLIFWISDYTLNKRCCFNLSKSIMSQKTIIDTIFTLPDEGVYINLNDTVRLIKTSVPGNIHFKLQDIKTQKDLTKYEILKSYIPNYTPDASLSMGLTKHPHRSLVIGNMLFFNQINFFDFDNQKKFSISYGQPINIFKTSKLPDDQLRMYYSAVVLTGRYIYALYQNKSMKQFPYFIPGIEIHVFDEEGCPIKKIHILENINYFAVDEQNNYIYGINAQEEIYQYSMINQAI